jgi:hypothetical protein
MGGRSTREPAGPWARSEHRFSYRGRDCLGWPSASKPVFRLLGGWRFRGARRAVRHRFRMMPLTGLVFSLAA